MPLPSRAFDALLFLIDRRGRIVSKSEIIAAIWDDVAVTDDSLVHVISVLRRELRDDRNNPRFIRTIPRRGYRFIAAVTESEEPPGAESALAGTRPSVAHVVHAISAGRLFTPARIGWAAGVGAVAVVLALMRTGEPSPDPNDDPSVVIQFSLRSPPGSRIVSAGVLSPDARYVAFVAFDETDGRASLWVRTLATSETRRLSGTDGASKPFWAPDGRRIGFFAGANLFTTTLSAEQPRVVAAVEMTPAGGSWGPDDTIIFAAWSGGLRSVDAAGRHPVESIVELDHSAHDLAITQPQFLPDGRHFLYHLASLDDSRTGTYLGDLVGQGLRRLSDTDSPAVFAPPQHLLHVHDGMLIAEELDMDRLELTGRARIVARGVAAPTLDADNMVSATTELLAYRNGVQRQNLAWFDRNGRQLRALPLPTVIYNPRLSPDQSQVLATGSIRNDPGLWVASTSDEKYARLEPDAIAPLWAPDGRSVAFTSHGGFELMIRATDSRDAKRKVLADTTVKILNDWSPDGEEIVYTTADHATGLDLWAAHLATGSAHPLLATPSNETQARLSPDGNWIAYASDESGNLEVYVQRYPLLGDKRRVSSNGGGQPQWRADSRELFYLAADRTIMSVGVDRGPAGLEFQAPQALFRASISGDAEDAREYYIASNDGSRFLIDATNPDPEDGEITIVMNWTDEDRQHRKAAAPMPGSISQPLR